MSPKVAVWTTFLVPGLAHFLLGRAVLGLLAFVSSLGLFWAGYALVADRIWFCELIAFDAGGMWGQIFNRLPIQLLPESPNFGSTVIAGLLREPESSAAVRMIRMPREWDHLGLLLTGCSGIVAALWAADAHWRARGLTARVAPAKVAALTWLLPGSGHWVLGQREKGVLFGAATVVLFAFGVAVAGGHAADRVAQPAWWIADSLCGAGVVFTSFVTAPMRMAEFPEHRDLGAAVCAAAGLMNLILMCSAYTLAEDAAGDTAAEAGGAPEGTA